jgi:hypothetical protein
MYAYQMGYPVCESVLQKRARTHLTLLLYTTHSGKHDTCTGNSDIIIKMKTDLLYNYEKVTESVKIKKPSNAFGTDTTFELIQSSSKISVSFMKS